MEWVEYCPSCSLSRFFFFRCPDSGGISSSLCLALFVKLPSGERHRILVMIRQDIGAGNGLVSSGTRASLESSSTNLVSSDQFSLPWELSPGIMVDLFRSLEILQRIRASCWSFTCVMTWLRPGVKDALFETFHGTRQYSSSVVFLNPFLPGYGVPLFCHLCNDVTEGAILKQF